MYKVTESDGHNEPTLHVFKDESHAVQWMTQNATYLDEDMIADLIEDGEVKDDNMATWRQYDGYYTIDHTKE